MISSSRILDAGSDKNLIYYEFTVQKKIKREIILFDLRFQSELTVTMILLFT